MAESASEGGKKEGEEKAAENKKKEKKSAEKRKPKGSINDSVTPTKRQRTPKKVSDAAAGTAEAVPKSSSKLSAVAAGQAAKKDLAKFFEAYDLDPYDEEKEEHQTMTAQNPYVRSQQTKMCIPVLTIEGMQAMAEDKTRFNWAMARTDLTSSRSAVGNFLRGVHGRYTPLSEGMVFSKDKQGHLFPRMLMVYMVKTFQICFGGGAGTWLKRLHDFYSGLKKQDTKLKFLISNCTVPKWTEEFMQQVSRSKVRSFTITYPEGFEIEEVLQPDLIQPGEIAGERHNLALKNMAGTKRIKTETAAKQGKDDKEETKEPSEAAKEEEAATEKKETPKQQEGKKKTAVAGKAEGEKNDAKAADKQEKAHNTEKKEKKERKEKKEKTGKKGKESTGTPAGVGDDSVEEIEEDLDSEFVKAKQVADALEVTLAEEVDLTKSSPETPAGTDKPDEEA